MPLITLTTTIAAPIEICFNLSLSIDLHMLSTASTNEVAIAGVTSGLIKKGETVTWQATHFGVRQQLTVRIEEVNSPHFFSDRMMKGAFKSMYHEHHFEVIGGKTVMTDAFNFESPFGVLGRLFNSLVLTRYMTGFLHDRNNMIKQFAEGDEWRRLISKP